MVVITMEIVMVMVPICVIRLFTKNVIDYVGSGGSCDRSVHVVVVRIEMRWLISRR